jgi:hypothetical protein
VPALRLPVLAVLALVPGCASPPRAAAPSAPSAPSAPRPHRIDWVEDHEATGRLAELYAELRGPDGSRPVADVLRTMSHRPDFLAAVRDASRMHFSDGALTRAQHEMIAAYVSALNRCHY